MFANEENLEFDCVIVGGGLAGGLLLHGLKVFQPDLRVVLLEKETHLSQHQTWCFHSTDLPVDHQWLDKLISKKWSHQKVAFPEYERILKQEYNAMRSSEFSDFLMHHYGDSIRLGVSVESLSQQQARLSDGRMITASQVVDARGWNPVTSQYQGFQKFVGWDVTLENAHGLEYVLLKDARIPQTDGYRFFYLLPWTAKSLLVEDTYYSNSSDLNHDKIGEEIQKYISEQGWKIASVDRKEAGCLPLPYFAEPSVAKEFISLGARSGIFHPVTGYTFPDAVARVDLIIRAPLTEWRDLLADYDRYKKSQMSFLLKLNRMLFLAAEPELRYKVLQRFYKLPADLIGRFYKGELKAFDWLRILIGKPPVPISKALKQILGI